MLTKRYLTGVKNVPAIFQKIVSGTAPDKFTVEHLKSIGFASSSDRGIIPLLKDLGFLTAEGAPTTRYHEYRDPSRSKRVLGAALQESYQDLFHVNAKPTSADRGALEGKFKTTHNVADRVAEQQTATFLALLSLAALPDSSVSNSETLKPVVEMVRPSTKQDQEKHADRVLNLRYNIEIHLPPSKDVEVYNAIFKSLKEHLID